MRCFALFALVTVTYADDTHNLLQQKTIKNINEKGRGKCMCTKEYAPVCGVDGRPMAMNALLVVQMLKLPVKVSVHAHACATRGMHQSVALMVRPTAMIALLVVQVLKLPAKVCVRAHASAPRSMHQFVALMARHMAMIALLVVQVLKLPVRENVALT